MKNLFPLLFAALVLIFAGCTKCDDPLKNDITVRSTASYGDEPLVLFTPYVYPGGNKIKFTRVDFLIKGFTLSGNNLASIRTKDSVFVLNFTDTNLTPTGATDGIVKSFESSTGQFNLLSFGVGVDPQINSKKPENFTTPPLNDGFYYWQAWNSYIFLKVEGFYDINNDGSFDQPFAYHIGTDALYKTNVLLLKSQTGTEESNKIHLDFDIMDLLAAGGDAIDIENKPSSHNPADIAVSQKLFDHLSTAISIK